MTDKPILFNAEMVRAILDGRKTMTRRVVKPQPKHIAIPSIRACRIMQSVTAGLVDGQKVYNNLMQQCSRVAIHPKHGGAIKCPYGGLGDLLWVRETWRPQVRDVAELYIKYKADGACIASADAPIDGFWSGYTKRWRPSIHMPRWASRLTLRVKDVRVERVQDISDEDVAAEGTPGMIGGRYGCQECNNAGWTFSHPTACPACNGMGKNARQHFRQLWDSINAKRGFGWETNPWVFVVQFEVEK